MNEIKPSNPQSTGSGARFLYLFAAMIIVIAGLKAAQSILLPIMVAIFLAMLGVPLLYWMQRFGVPKVVAVTLVIVLLLGVLFGFGTLVGGSVDNFQEAIPRYRVRMEELTVSTIGWLNEHGINVSLQRVNELIDPGAVLGMVGNTLSTLISLLSTTLLVMLTMAFILVEAAAIPDKLKAALGDQRADISRFGQVTLEVQRYIVLKTAISIVTGLLVGLWCFILGIDFPVLWGLCGFILNFVPSIGSIIAALPPVMLALIQFGPGRAGAVIAGYAAVNMFLGNVVEPNLMGRRLGLSPLVVFLSLVFWGYVWGPVGMLLSVPMTIIVKIMFENSEDLRWIAILLDSDSGVQKRLREIRRKDDQKPAKEAKKSENGEKD